MNKISSYLDPDCVLLQLDIVVLLCNSIDAGESEGIDYENWFD